MRISAKRHDPGYHPSADRGGFQVLLDGYDVTPFCHTADEEEGRVYGYALDPNGHRYTDSVTGFPAEVVYSGEVEIVPMQNGARHAEPC